MSESVYVVYQDRKYRGWFVGRGSASSTLSYHFTRWGAVASAKRRAKADANPPRVQYRVTNDGVTREVVGDGTD